MRKAQLTTCPFCLVRTDDHWKYCPLCEICGDPSDEMDHRLAIEVARTLGPAAFY